MKIYFIILLLIATLCMSYAQDKNQTKSQEKKSEGNFQALIEMERIRLKNLAFCNCLQKSLQADSILVADGTAAAYVELGAYGIDAYIKVGEYAESYANQTHYNSKNHRSLALMKCLDFYNSLELDSLVRTLDSEIDTSQLIRFNR
jgi:hypothetical protein